ncbi:MAG TPA: signal recognition particle protein [Candidatus Binatia bacterium]|nr:signal recognition particle protein [Candidatus Binatia bacterium]
MFDGLTARLAGVLDSLRGQGRLTEDQVKGAVRELRMALLEADVALPVVREFAEQVRERAVAAEVAASLTPGQAFLGVVHQELTRALGGESAGLQLRAQPPVVILMCGLQGAGKTTTAGKLALWLREREKKRVAAVSCDVYRPAAIEQLRLVAGQAGVEFLPSAAGEEPVAIARRALDEARRRMDEVLIVDSAGRTTLDAAMMDEIAALHAALAPAETLFVLDAMTGQDAAATAKAFAVRVPLTGVILTKADGDTRGGAALSVRAVTGVPIKFLGTGEKLERLEAFHPERIAARILGQGDVMTLVEDAARRVDPGKAEQFAAKLKSGRSFDLDDFRQQLRQMQAMGGVAALLDKLPGGAAMQARLQQQSPEKDVKRSLAIIDSMTPRERRHPDLMKASHRRRIASGSGTQVQDVNRLMRQYEQARELMKKMAGGGMAKLMRGLAGRMPPGFPRR